MQKTYLFASSVLFLDETISQRTPSGQVFTQSVFQHLIDAICQFAEIRTAFCSDTVVFMQTGHNGIVLEQLQKLCRIVRSVFQKNDFFRQLFMRFSCMPCRSCAI